MADARIFRDNGDIREGMRQGIQERTAGELMRLYRVEGAGPPSPPPEWMQFVMRERGITEAMGRWFVQDASMLDWYREEYGERNRTVFVDVPASGLDTYRVANVTATIAGRTPASFSKDPDNEFFLPRELADRKQPCDAITLLPLDLEREGAEL